MKRQMTLCIALLAAGLLSAAPNEKVPQDAVEAVRLQQDLQTVEGVANRLRAERAQLGLGERHQQVHRSTLRGSEDTLVHRFGHTYKGLRVWGSESIVTTDLFGNPKAESIHDLRIAGDLDVEPLVSPVEAIAKAGGFGMERDSFGIDREPVRPRLRPVARPQHELLVYPIMKQVRVVGSENKADHELKACDLQDVVERYALAYYVQRRESSDTQSLIATDTIVDARTGEVLAQWDALQRGAAKATAKTLYNGDKQIDVNYTGTAYQLTDPTRATSTPFKVTPNNSSTVYSSTTAVFGNNTTSNTQTVAADAMYGVQVTYDMLKNCYSWTGRDNRNTGVNVKVHLAEDNAYFDGYSSLTFGDGVSYFKPLVSLDVVAHEFGHALCSSSANLTYSGESGGLNEANSDIIGTLTEFYAKGANGTGSTVPNTGGNWLLGNDVTKDGSALRHMDKPSLDGKSPDAWSSTLGNIDVHYSSGPANRMFYFLAAGSTASGNGYSQYLKYGTITGIGLHKAGQIWMRALTQKMTASTKYAAAYTACKAAAAELFGAGSVEENTVVRAFAGINVTPDIAPVGSQALSITTQPANKTVAPGTSVTFTVAAAGGTAPYKYQWYKNGSAVSGATSASYTFTAQSTDNGATFYAKVTDSASTPASLNSSSATLTVSTTTTTDKIVNGGFEAGASPWVGTTGAIGNWSSYSLPAYEGVNSVYFGGNGKTTTETLYQTVTIPSTATSATLSFYVRISTAETGTTAYDKLAIQVRNSSGTVLGTLATLSNANATSSYVLKSYNVSAYKGQTIRVHFNMTEDSTLQTTFMVDKVSLITQ